MKIKSNCKIAVLSLMFYVGSLSLTTKKANAEWTNWLEGLDSLTGIIRNTVELNQLRQGSTVEEAESKAESVEFPKDSCGDLAPKHFPAVVYRVYVEYKEGALESIRKHLCGDAWVVRNAAYTDKTVISIASFSEENISSAKHFAQELAPYFEGATAQRAVIEKLVE